MGVGKLKREEKDMLFIVAGKFKCRQRAQSDAGNLLFRKPDPFSLFLSCQTKRPGTIPDLLTLNYY